MCGKMVVFYHYTDREGLRGILKARMINMSPAGRYGKGVYFTRLSPAHGRQKIAENNWDGVWQSTERSGKVDYTISVKLPRRKVKRFGDIYLFPEDVDLDMTTYRVYSKYDDLDELEADSTDGDSSEEESSSESDSD